MTEVWLAGVIPSAGLLTQPRVVRLSDPGARLD